MDKTKVDEIKNKIRRKLIEKADAENTTIYEKILNELDLSNDDEEKLIEVLSNNVSYINKWVDQNLK